ncbi:MAG: glycosyltransferase family 4 protein [Candidatus Riflebacteria bacterium]|nr:glycosyltransferase family 4 protein [Candidatus Riflebacteria bacterium]
MPHTNILMEIPFLLVVVCMITTIISSIGCGFMRYVSIKKSVMIDVPNHRSLHEQPMPRAGGAPMALAAIAGVTFLGLIRPHLLPAKWLLTIAIGGGVVAWIGWLDDKSSLSAKTRFMVHIIASAWAVNWLVPAETPFLGKLAAGFWVAWAINFYNFMDGIDGLAGAEAVVIALGAGYIAGRLGILGSLTVAWVIAASALGFLFWNWPPAKIFMGDAGSGFLGYAFGCLAIGSGTGWAGGFYTYLLLLALFWGDASFTLLKRILRGERFWEAHRQHLYQQAVQKGYSHHEVTLSFVTLNMLLFIAAALMAGIGTM